MGVQRRVDERHDLVDEALATETRRLDRSDGPVQRDGDAVFELLVGFLQDFRRDDVEGAEDILFAVLIEDAPSAA